MAKDPAFLFYYQDFLVGTSFMTLEELGAYTKLLCFQAARGIEGSLNEKEILKKIPAPIWEAIWCKFEKDEKGFFNRRLRDELKKRRNFTESRLKNLHMGTRMGTHMDTRMENEDVNEDIKEDIKSFFSYYLSKTGKKFKLTPSNYQLIKKRIEGGATIEQLKYVVDRFVEDDWSGRKEHLDLIYCIGHQRSKPDNLEKWLNTEPKGNKPKTYKGS